MESYPPISWNFVVPPPSNFVEFLGLLSSVECVASSILWNCCANFVELRGISWFPQIVVIFLEPLNFVEFLGISWIA